MKTETLQSLLKEIQAQTGVAVAVTVSPGAYAVNFPGKHQSFGTWGQALHELVKLKREGGDVSAKRRALEQQAKTLKEDARALGVKLEITVQGEKV